MTRPLAGVRVLDLTELQAAYATRLLADLGADVVKLERPQGDPVRWAPPMVGSSSALHRILNAGKRSVVLDLKSDDGRRALEGLAASADVVVESFRPGVMDRLGVGPARLLAVNEALVYVSITGYGGDGPYRDRAGHDINYIGIAGILDKTGSPGGPPVVPSVQVADMAGATTAALAAVAALVARAAGGPGGIVEVAMTDVALSWASVTMAPWAAGAPEFGRGEWASTGALPCYRPYECSDGRFVAVGAMEPKFWRALCTAIGRPDLVDEQWGDSDGRAATHRALEAAFRSRTRDEWTELFSSIDACVTPVLSYEEVARDPHLRARGMVRAGHDGVAVEFGSPLARDAATARAPELGEHTVEVFTEAGGRFADEPR